MPASVILLPKATDEEMTHTNLATNTLIQIRISRAGHVRLTSEAVKCEITTIRNANAEL